jgi:hypothetical protein
MKPASLITAVAFVASSSVWAGVATPPLDPPFSVNQLKKLQNTVDSVDGSKITSTKLNAEDLGPLMCNRALGKKEEVVAVMPCPVDRLPAEGFQLGVYSTDTSQEAPDCQRIPVTVSDYIAAGDGSNTTAISAIVDIDYTANGITLQWVANAQIDASIVKDNKSALNGFNCVSKGTSKAGTGLVNGDPISNVKLKLGNVKGGSSVIQD